MCSIRSACNELKFISYSNLPSNYIVKNSGVSIYCCYPEYTVLKLVLLHNQTFDDYVSIKQIPEVLQTLIPSIQDWT